MKLLITNDDGIGSAGLRRLASDLTTIGEVTVFAPSGQYSGSGTAIGNLDLPLPDVCEVSTEGLGGIEAAYMVDGPPALTALLACKGLFATKSDIVVSGVNLGLHVGRSVHFSGTVGAAIGAAAMGVRGIAISQDEATNGEQRSESATNVLIELLKDVSSLPELANINVPNLPFDQLSGLLSTRLSDRSPYGMSDATMHPSESNRFGVSFASNERFDNTAGTDTHAVANGFVSVTELHALSG